MTTSSSNAVGGTLTFQIDGNPYAVRGNFTVSAANVKREWFAGQDGSRYFTETPVVPSIKGDLITDPSFSYSTLEAITNSTIQVALKNGTTYVLSNAAFNSGAEINTQEGRIACEFSGQSIQAI